MRRHNLVVTFAILAAAPLVAAGFTLSAAFDNSTLIAATLAVLFAFLLAAVALASTGLHRHARENERLAKHDVLTGIPNRMLFTRRLEALLAQGKPVGLILGDIDRFKEVNDRFGHGAGDDVLRQTADRLCASVRATDTVARLGGDEFGILLPGADVEGAGQIARRIGEALSSPMSLGIACSPDHGDDFEMLLQAADLAMYEAKQHGGGVRIGDRAREKSKAPGQAIGGLRPVRRAAPAKSG